MECRERTILIIATLERALEDGFEEHGGVADALQVGLGAARGRDGGGRA